jgi:ubiquinone/menaquinone biosynthesis C-methylase UbiE
MASFNHFDFLAPIYDHFIKPKDPVKLRSLLKLPVSGNLLDVGGGTGRISIMLRDSVTRIVIADSSIGMLAQARNKNSFIIVCTDSEGLPFEDGSFERVIMVDAFHHVYDYKSTVEELWRVVKPGGRIVIEEPNIHTIPVMITAIVEKLALMRSHFISPLVIFNSFPYPNAKKQIESEGFTSWIVVDKEGEP